MPRYNIKVNSKTIVFRARSDREARLKAFRISKSYTNFKRLESRWWLLIYPLMFVVGYLFVGELGG